MAQGQGIVYQSTEESAEKSDFVKLPFNERLRRLRVWSEKTQRDVARELHIDRSTYAYYETGKTEPRIENLITLSQIFGVTIDELLRGL